MAEKTRIRVAVVEGNYAELCGLGLPLSLSLQLQCLNLKLSGALWSAKASASGFSVSLYWPTADRGTTRGSVSVKAKKARKNRKRRRKLAPASVANHQVTVPPVPAIPSQPLNKSVCLNREHPSPDRGSPVENPCNSGSEQCSIDGDSPSTMSSSSSAVDLTVCSNVQYEMKDSVHGVSFTSHLGEPGWTPVIGKKKKKIIPDYVKRRFPPDHPIHHREDQSDTESGTDLMM